MITRVTPKLVISTAIGVIASDYIVSPIATSLFQGNVVEAIIIKTVITMTAIIFIHRLGE